MGRFRRRLHGVRDYGWLVALLAATACTAGGGETGTEPYDGGSESGQQTGSGPPGTGPSTTAGTMGTSGGSDSTPSTTGPGTSASTTTDTDDATGQPPVDGPLLDRIVVTDVTVPQGVRAGVANWRIWGRGDLNVAPVFTVPTETCDTLVGFTNNDLVAQVARLDAEGALVEVLDLGAGRELRGLAPGSEDGSFGALLWDPTGQQIFVTKYGGDGAEAWSTQLTNPDNTPTDFEIGDSRLEYGGGTYGAYYHVHSDSGHEGDTLKWVDAQSGTESTGWSWGCSHSMSNVLRFNPATDAFLPACVTDCFPGTNGDFGANAIGGIYVNHSDGHVIDVDAGCNGDVAGELGSAGLTDAGWNLVFNAHQAPASLGQGSYNPATMNQDVGFSVVDGGFAASAVVWLTNTDGVNEDDTSVARWRPTGDAAEQYVVGWHEPETASYQLARIDGAGGFLEGPVDVTGTVAWGRRDDPFRTHANDDVVWSWFDAPGSTTLHFARIQAGGACP